MNEATPRRTTESPSWLKELARRLMSDDGPVTVPHPRAPSVNRLSPWIGMVCHASQPPRALDARPFHHREDVPLRGVVSLLDLVLDLQPTLRDPTLLRFADHLDREEVARRLGTDATAIGTRLSCGRTQLRTLAARRLGSRWRDRLDAIATETG